MLTGPFEFEPDEQLQLAGIAGPETSTEMATAESG
jgi:hypothetical protein